MTNGVPTDHEYVVRTKCVSGNVLRVIDFVCSEFIVSKQTAKRMIRSGSVLTRWGHSEASALADVERYAEHGLITECALVPELPWEE